MHPTRRAYLSSLARLAESPLEQRKAMGKDVIDRDEIEHLFGERAALALDDFRAARRSYRKAVRQALDEMENDPG